MIARLRSSATRKPGTKTLIFCAVTRYLRKTAALGGEVRRLAEPTRVAGAYRFAHLGYKTAVRHGCAGRWGADRRSGAKFAEDGGIFDQEARE